MPGNLELLKAFELFGRSMQDLNRASAVRQVNEQADELTAQQKAITTQLETARAFEGPPTPEQREETAGLQKQFEGFLEQKQAFVGRATGFLTAAGVAPARIKTLFPGPSPIELQIEAQKESQERRFKFEEKKVKLAAPGLAIKAEERAKGQRIKLRTDFVTKVEADTKPLRRELRKTQGVTALIDTGFLSAFNQARKLQIRLVEGGRLTDQDFELSNVTPETIEQVKAFFAEKLTGAPTEEQKRRLKKLFKVLITSAQRSLSESIRGASDAAQLTTENILQASKLENILTKKFGAALRGFNLEAAERGAKVRGLIFGAPQRGAKVLGAEVTPGGARIFPGREAPKPVELTTEEENRVRLEARKDVVRKGILPDSQQGQSEIRKRIEQFREEKAKGAQREVGAQAEREKELFLEEERKTLGLPSLEDLKRGIGLREEILRKRGVLF